MLDRSCVIVVIHLSNVPPHDKAGAKAEEKRVERAPCSLARLHNGFYFAIPEDGGLVMELVRVDLAWQQEPDWSEGMLAIARGYSRQELALGHQFFALLVVAEQAEIIGAKITESYVPVRFGIRQVYIITLNDEH